MALQPGGKGLVIETLRYADEIQKADQFFTEVPAAKPDKELLSLAEELIERKAKPFDPKAFKDPYEAALRELIDAKIENRPPEAIEEPQLGAKVIDLMDALKRSVGGQGAARRLADQTRRRRPRRPSRPSAPRPRTRPRPRRRQTSREGAPGRLSPPRGRHGGAERSGTTAPKRDFTKTSEPSGEDTPPPVAAATAT